MAFFLPPSDTRFHASHRTHTHVKRPTPTVPRTDPQWRVEERDDWRALLDSMQADRTALQRQNDRLEGELTRCITALLSIFPSSSPFTRSGRAKGGDANGTAARGGGKKGADDADHPPELTHRSISSGSDGRWPVSSRGIAAVDLEWVGSLAEEFNVVLEGVVAE
ncbi:unnamed protein product, partial [Ectocarpus sp. 12 AP-2014]